jgi:hypothetical protein
MNCQFLNDDGSCQHVNAAVGLPIIMDPSACQFCLETNPKPETRHESYPVRNVAWRARKERGLSVGEMPRYVPKPKTETQRREHRPRKNIADEVLAVAKTVPRVFPKAPVIDDPKARLEICTGCDFWIGERCKGPGCQTCSNRPRPEATKGRDCPIGLWRRG